MNSDSLTIFALNSSKDFGESVCAHLGLRLGAHEEREFEDGEHKARPLENVRGKDVFVIQSLYADERQNVNDKLCRMLFFLGALHDASTARVTAVAPYLCYSRKDRKSKRRDPVTTRYVAAMFEAVGVGGVITLDVHNLAAYQNAWRIPADHLEAKTLFIDHFARLAAKREVVIVSPDVGGVKRAEEFRQAFGRALGREVHGAFLEKFRSQGVVSGQTFVAGDVKNKTAIVIDDLIGSGTTIVRAAEACRAHGAAAVYAAASHGVFGGDARNALLTPLLDGVAVTNTIPPFRLGPDLSRYKLTVLDCAPLFAEAIRRMHAGGSIVEMLDS